MESISLEKLCQFSDGSERLFDNPLSPKFLTPEGVGHALGYSVKWVRQQMTSGALPFHRVGRKLELIYLPDLEGAILSGALAPTENRKVHHDTNNKNAKRNKIPSPDQSERICSIQDLRNLQRG